MNVTREVIIDLWPVYTAGEASADTRALVEEFLRQDPELAKVLQANIAPGLLPGHIPQLPPDQEAKSLNRIKQLLNVWNWSLFLAMLFSGLAFGRIISDTSWDVSPINFIIMASIAIVFWVIFFVRIVRIRHQIYRIKPGPANATKQ